MDKKTIVRTLEAIALYMELKSENPFKISAFRKAAQTLELDSRSLSEMDDILKLKGIGKGTGAVIEDMLATGRSTLLEELEASIPKGLVPLLRIPGLGGKKIAKLYAALGIDSAESLKRACERGDVHALAGFGVKTEEKLLRELEAMEARPDRFAYWKLEPIVASIEDVLRRVPEVRRFDVAGSFRRTSETSSDLDFVIATDRPATVRARLLSDLSVAEVIAAGDTKVSVTLEGDAPVDCDFRLVTDEQYASALLHFTGSKEHNVKLRQIAKGRGEKISEYGVEQPGGAVLTFEGEEAFYRHFDLPYFPPPTRGSGAEFEKTALLPGLIQQDAIVADLHMHTVFSDGAHSIGEMADACAARGYRYMAITDHSRFLKVAHGLTPMRLQEQIERIEEENRRRTDIAILSGTEMDILPDGTLDFDDELLGQLDFVIASIHSSFAQPRAQMMERLHRAIANPHVDMIAHPTGRVIEQRPGYDADVGQLLQWAKEYGKIVELNANPYRFDLAVSHLEQAAALGVPIAINTDAHSTGQLRYMETGVRYAQRAFLQADQIVNTWPLEKLRAFCARS